MSCVTLYIRILKIRFASADTWKCFDKIIKSRTGITQDIL